MDNIQKDTIAKAAVETIITTLKLSGINYFELPKDIQKAMVSVFQSGAAFSLEVAKKIESQG